MKKIAIILLLAAGCSHQPTSVSKLNPQDLLGSWTSNLVVKELKSGRVNSVRVDIFSESIQKSRWEVTALMGIPVASIAWRDQVVEVYLPRDHKFFRAKTTDPRAMEMWKLPLPPETLRRIYFENFSNLSCKENAGERICQKDSWTLHFKNFENKREILIESPENWIRWTMTRTETKVQVTDAMFEIKPPKEVQVIDLTR